ncbi:hypothetical protein KCP76_18065 [Salmonella enterica subsp. enterica serovar Weltevreden]|nr:hypothetical protein KCP76_18065 [Salmonella enterica subsp. enterica serovar Weltevreden]
MVHRDGKQTNSASQIQHSPSKATTLSCVLLLQLHVPYARVFMKQTVYIPPALRVSKFTSGPEPRRDADAGAGRGCARRGSADGVVGPDKRYLYVGVRPEFRCGVSYCAGWRADVAAESALPGSPTLISTDHHGRFCLCPDRITYAGNVSVTRHRMVCRLKAGGCGGRADGCHSANITLITVHPVVPALKQDRICLFTLKR